MTYVAVFLTCFSCGKSVRSPAFRRKRSASRNGSASDACGLKAGLRTDFPQELYYIINRLTLPEVDESRRLREPPPTRPAARRPWPRSGSSIVNGKSVFNPPLVVDILTSASRLAGILTRTSPLVEPNSMSPAPLSCMISTSTLPLVDLPLTVPVISPTWTLPLVELALTAPATPLTVTLPLVDLASRSPLTPVTSTSPLTLEIGSNL